ncbi:MAG: SCP-like extracellular [Ruminococcus sp.]|nr:SCP-like extracellular [Ruminococcus sp.]
MKAKLNYTKRIISAFVAMMVSAVCASVPVTSSGSIEPDYKEMANELMILVNNARTDAGLKPLLTISFLNDSSQIRARESVSYFSHERPSWNDEVITFDTVIDDNMIPWEYAYENLANGMDTVEATFMQWQNSPKHWATIMNPDVQYMSAAVTYDPNSDHGWYWEQMFIKLPDDIYEGIQNNDQKIIEEFPIFRDTNLVYDPAGLHIKPVSNGDIDGDGVVDIFDVVLLERYLNGDERLNTEQLASADIVVDGAVTVMDVEFLRMYVLGEIPELQLDVGVALRAMLGKK